MSRIKTSVVELVKDAVGTDDFIIVELAKDGSPKPVYGTDGQLLKFRSGADASRAARDMSKPGGPKYQPRRVKDDKWTERELKRFATKEYQPLPWADAVWWRNHAHIHGEHYPHVSTKNSVGLMAFTESPEKGSADIQTAIKPGKYLERFFSSVLDPYIIRDLCTIFSNKFEDNCLIFSSATDEQEWETLYTTGPGSCMSHAPDRYASHIHPVRVYAAGDLQLAYMKRDGRIVARTIVYPEKKLYSRVYGDSGRIEPLLKQVGYRKGPPVGAKMQRVVTWQNKSAKTGNRALVMPHVDDVSYAIDHGEFLRIGDPTVSPDKVKGAVRMAGANGLSEWISCGCARCNGETTNSQMVNVICDDYGEEQQRWCKDCAEDSKMAFKDPTTKYIVRINRGVEMHDGTLWWKRSFEERGFMCHGTRKRYENKLRVNAKDEKGLVRSFSTEYFKANGGHICNTCGVNTLGDCAKSCKDNYAKGRERGRRLSGYDHDEFYTPTTSTTSTTFTIRGG